MGLEVRGNLEIGNMRMDIKWILRMNEDTEMFSSNLFDIIQLFHIETILLARSFLVQTKASPELGKYNN